MSKERILLTVIIVLSFCFRLYHFSSPIADWHSWRQADTSSVSRMFLQKGFDMLHPKFDDLSNVPSGLDNPEGYRFVEFPIYNFLQAAPSMAFGLLTLEEWGRLVTMVGMAFSTVFVFAIVKRHGSSPAALLSSFFFSFLPYNIYYGRVTLPDPLMVTATLGGIYFFDLWIAKGISSKSSLSILYCVMGIFLSAVALLLKPFAAFFLVPMIILAYNQFGFSFLKRWQLYIFSVLSVLPLGLWRFWITQYPEGIPVSNWLFNGGNIRFKGAYFYWIFGEHIGKEILGYAGYGLLLLGILVVTSRLYMKNRKDMLFLLSFLFGTVLYVSIVARGNVQHDYYQIPILPTLAIFMGFGGAFLIDPLKEFSSSAGRILFVSFTLFTFFFGWYTVRDFFNINNPSIVRAGAAVNRLTPPNAKVIALYDGDTSFLYQTHRSGWASFEKSLPEMITLGAQYLVIANPTPNDLSGFGTTYPIVAEDSSYLILKLQ
jgi:hypothetical protein